MFKLISKGERDEYEDYISFKDVIYVTYRKDTTGQTEDQRCLASITLVFNKGFKVEYHSKLATEVYENYTKWLETNK